MSLELTADAIQQNSTIPYASFQNYEIYATHAKKMSGLKAISYAPVVAGDQKDEFVKYALENKEWVSSSRKLGMLLDPNLAFDNIDNATLRPFIFDVNSATQEAIPATGIGPFAPLWHTSPPPKTQDDILYNIASIPELKHMLDLIESGQGSCLNVSFAESNSHLLPQIPSLGAHFMAGGHLWHPL